MTAEARFLRSSSRALVLLVGLAAVSWEQPGARRAGEAALWGFPSFPAPSPAREQPGCLAAVAVPGRL